MLISVFETGDSLFGLPMANTAEVIPHPGALSPVPGARPGLMGLFMLREANIPLLDVLRLSGADSPSAEGGIILVAAEGGRLAGLSVAALHGMVELDEAAMQAHAAAEGDAGGPRLFTRSFRYEGRLGYLIEPAALLALPGIPVAIREALRFRRKPVEGASPCLFFRAGTLKLGVSATAVEATVPEAPIQESPLTSSLCHGAIAYLDRVIPVVDPLVLIGLAQARAQRAVTSAIVLRVPPSGLIAIAVDAITEFAVPETEFSAPPAVACMIDSGVFKRLAGLADGSCHLLLDAAALTARPQVEALSRLSFQKPDAGVRPGRGRREAQADQSFLFFRAGRRFAAALGQIKRIVLEPAEMVRFPACGNGLSGFFTVDGESAVLVDLAGLMGLEASGAAGDSRVLLIDHLPVQLGFRVEELIAVERSVLQTARGEASARSALLPPALMVPLATRQGSELVEYIDLKQLALEMVLASAAQEQDHPALLAAG